MPNHYKCYKDSDRIKIITGPNASGKTIYLKQICLIVYLVHLGSFVPAKFANITIIDRIFTKIKSNESFSSGLSSFFHDLQQMALPLKDFTDHSLIAIDEFGKATDYVSGQSLLASIIDYFGQKLKPPHLLVLTHFHSLSEYITKAENVSYFTFQVNVDEEEVKYRYQLIEGKAKSSLSLTLAKSVGIDEKVIERALDIKMRIEKKLNIEALCIASIEKRTKSFLDIFQHFEKLTSTSNFDTSVADSIQFLTHVHNLT